MKGFSFAEFILTMGLVVFVGWKGIEFIDEQKREILYGQQEVEITGVVQDMRRLLQAPESCQASFQSLNPQEEPGMINHLTHVTRVQNKNFQSQRYPTHQTKAQTYGTGKLRLESYQLSRPEDAESFSTDLVIRFDRIHALPKDQPRYHEERIRLYYELDEQGLIASCSLSPQGVAQQYWQLLDDGTLNYFKGRVGVGLTNPTHTLHLDGRLQLSSEGPRPPCRAQERGTLWRQQETIFYCDGSLWLQL